MVTTRERSYMTHTNKQDAEQKADQLEAMDHANWFGDPKFIDKRPPLTKLREQAERDYTAGISFYEDLWERGILDEDEVREKWEMIRNRLDQATAALDRAGI